MFACWLVYCLFCGLCLYAVTRFVVLFIVCIAGLVFVLGRLVFDCLCRCGLMRFVFDCGVLLLVV